MSIINKIIYMQWVNWCWLMSAKHQSVNQLKTQWQIAFSILDSTHWEFVILNNGYQGVLTVVLLMSAAEPLKKHARVLFCWKQHRKTGQQCQLNRKKSPTLSLKTLTINLLSKFEISLLTRSSRVSGVTFNVLPQIVWNIRHSYTYLHSSLEENTKIIPTNKHFQLIRR